MMDVRLLQLLAVLLLNGVLPVLSVGVFDLRLVSTEAFVLILPIVLRKALLPVSDVLRRAGVLDLRLANVMDVGSVQLRTIVVPQVPNVLHRARVLFHHLVQLVDGRLVPLPIIMLIHVARRSPTCCSEMKFSISDSPTWWT
ncbi:unnamed protein product [Prorocentrum cordatum]|uniref:Secreted protein n=1 Tax=Prorocentrum cordatum TaxID=2364126 RepID=A0ABN9VXL9_9DINO|nr:unnamed protein product [Polarella glacialis]